MLVIKFLMDWMWFYWVIYFWLHVTSTYLIEWNNSVVVSFPELHHPVTSILAVNSQAGTKMYEGSQTEPFFRSEREGLIVKRSIMIRAFQYAVTWPYFIEPCQSLAACHNLKMFWNNINVFRYISVWEITHLLAMC